MAITAFEITGKLKLDSSDFKEDLNKIKKSSEGLFDTTAIKNGVEVINGVGKSLIGFGRSSISASASFESAFTGVRKTVDATEDEYAQLSDWIMDASTKMASSKEDIAGTMEIAGQLGVRGVDGLEKFTETMIMLGDTTNLNAEEAASSLAKFGNIAGLDATQMDRIGSSIVALGNNFATTEADIVAMSSRLASAGTIAGMSATDILGLSTAMSSVGINAEAGGTAMSTIITKIGRAVDAGVDDANEELQLLADTAGMTMDEFAAAWKDKPTAALQQFVLGLDSVIDSGGNVTAILDDLGMKGIRETNTIKSLALASDVLTSAVDTANSAFEDNTALMHEAEQRYGTTESQMLQTQEALKTISIELGTRLLPYVNRGIDFISELIKKWDSLSDTQKDAIIKIGLVVAAGATLITTLGKVAMGIKGIISIVKMTKTVGMNLISGVKKLWTVLAAHPIVLIIAGIAALVTAFVVLWNKSEAFRNFWKTLWNTIKVVAKTVIDAVAGFFKTAWNTIKVVWSTAGKFFSTIWNTIKGIFSVVADILGGFFSAAWDIIKGVWNVVVAFFQGIWNGIKGVFSVVADVIGGFFSTAWSGIKGVWDTVVGFFEGIWEGIKSAFSGVAEFFKSAFGVVTDVLGGVGDMLDVLTGKCEGLAGTAKGAAESILDVMKQSGKLPGFPTYSGSSAGMPSNIPRHADGGVFYRPTLGIFGEAGAEAVVPLDQNTKWVHAVATDFAQQISGMGLASAGGGDIIIPVYIGQNRIDEIIVSAQQRLNYRSGGRA